MGRILLFPKLLLGAVLIFFAPRIALAGDDGPEPAKLEFFEKKIRPLLAENCFKCHGPEKQKAGLRLDSLASIMKGGDSGPAVAPGKPEESLLVEAGGY